MSCYTVEIKRSIYLKCVAFPEQDPPFKHSDGLHGSDSNWQFFPVYPAIKVLKIEYTIL